jgi:hypothetical protein
MAKTRTIDGHVSATKGRGKKTRIRKLTIKNIEGKVNERENDNN